jgi:hypothetical protein
MPCLLLDRQLALEYREEWVAGLNDTPGKLTLLGPARVQAARSTLIELSKAVARARFDDVEPLLAPALAQAAETSPTPGSPTLSCPQRCWRASSTSPCAPRSGRSARREILSPPTSGTGGRKKPGSPSPSLPGG